MRIVPNTYNSYNYQLNLQNTNRRQTSNFLQMVGPNATDQVKESWKKAEQEVANRDQRQQEKVSAAALIIKVIREKRHKQNTGRILTLQQGVYDHKGGKQPKEDTTAEYHRCLRIVGKHLF